MIAIVNLTHSFGIINGIYLMNDPFLISTFCNNELSNYQSNRSMKYHQNISQRDKKELQ